MSQEACPDKTRRALITVSCMLATVMVTLDGTIANVALPHMQSSVSASYEQIIWVLTSYMIASAVVTALSGWLADRFGRKRVMLVSVAGFTLFSMACGIATSLTELVLFRIFQGMFGASLVPLSQSTLLDINPPERHGQAMAVYGMGTILGPVVGPTLGGYLTEVINWRWIFFINAPVGILAFLGLSAFMTGHKDATRTRFDMFGFACIAIFIGSFQLFLDRGHQLDWFDSWEICLYATLAVTFLYVTVVHMFTAKKPFLRPSLFRDRNFVTATIVGVQLGLTVYTVFALLSPMLQQLMGYPVMLTGLVTAPRGVGTMIGMFVTGRLIGRIDPRYILFAGLVTAAVSMYDYAHISLAMDSNHVAVIGLVQGVGAGMIFVPLSTILFSTLPARYRNEAAALNTLVRTMGGAVGISVLQTLTLRNTDIVRSRLVEEVRPDNPIVALAAPGLDFFSTESLARMTNEVIRQASMVAYVDSFWLLFLLTIAAMPLILLMRYTRPRPGEMPEHMPIME